MTPLSVLRRFKYVRELEQENGRLRERLARYHSMDGAGPPGQANCDTLALKAFVGLEHDYRQLERAFWEVVGDLRLLRLTLKRLADGA